MIPFYFIQFDKLPGVVLSRFATNFCVSPLAWCYIILLGEYDLKKDKLQDNTGVLPPNLHPESSRKIWSRQKGNASNISTRSGIPYGGIGTFCQSRSTVQDTFEFYRKEHDQDGIFLSIATRSSDHAKMHVEVSRTYNSTFYQ